MKYKLTFALVASLTGSAFAAFQAPLPEFKNEKQLAEWRAEKTSETTSQGYVAEETAFYTGKPYLASSGDYTFKYRSYNPELTRWTSEDPSGFPDGANNIIYSNNPLEGVDSNGLAWSNIDFIKHFYLGGGASVNLATIGLLAGVQAVANTNPTGGLYRFGKQIERTADAISKPFQGRFADSFSNNYSFKSVLFSLGSGTLGGVYDGWMTSTPYSSGSPGGTYSYDGTAAINYSDSFTDPLTVMEHLYGSSTGGPSWLQALTNLGGTPFQILGTWDKQYSGFGYYE